MQSPTNAGVFEFTQYNPNVSNDLQRQVLDQLCVQNTTITPEVAFNYVNEYFKQPFASNYFNTVNIAQIAKHINATNLNRQIAAITNDDLSVTIVSDNSRFDYISATRAKVIHTESAIIDSIKKTPADQNISLIVSTTATPESMYLLTTGEYVPAVENSTKIADICSTTFIANKSDELIANYQEIVSDAANTLAPVAKVFPINQYGATPIMFAYKATIHDSPLANLFLKTTQLLNNAGLKTSRKYLETFSNNVTVISLYVNPTAAQLEENVIAKVIAEMSLMAITPDSDVLCPAFFAGFITAEEYTYFTAVSKVVYYVISSRPEEYTTLSNHLQKDTLILSQLRHLYTTIRREAVSHARIQQTMLKNIALAKKIYADFEKRQITDQLTSGVIPANTEIESLIKSKVAGNMEQQIFQAMLSFNKNTPKTNFFLPGKSAISFRLEPDFFVEMDLPRLPFAVFFVVEKCFQAMHVRFADVSRGGIRLIRSFDETFYNKNVQCQFEESYNLAFTQNLKNKDIPEFGSKGTVLLNADTYSQTQGIVSFKRFIDSLLDLIAQSKDKTKQIVDNYGKPELLFLGPDEGTAGVMSWAALYAKERGYPYWRAFTTGKPANLGGVPHDVFAMTTNSVHRYVLGCLRKLGLNESEMTKMQTGGPDGDLGSNEIKISHDKTIAIVDGSGILYDPAGLNREEIFRCATARIMSVNFDKTKLSPEGFFVSVDDKDLVLPNGEVVQSGLQFRNDFHLSKYATADMFVPCGGRPRAVDLSNVKKLFNEAGAPKFKIIVEGANLFFTQEARLVLEAAGVTMIKDASANKGGVTSSSLEVLAALSLTQEDFEKSMAVHDPQNPPALYTTYVKEIQQRIINDADAEFECIWMEYERTKEPKCILTDKISNKINEINYQINDSNLWDNTDLRITVLKKLLPQTLQNFNGFDVLIETAPESYLRASFNSYLASRAVYKYGYEVDVVALFDLSSQKSFLSVLQ